MKKAFSKRFTFNIIDVILIVLILASLASLIYLFTAADDSDTPEVKKVLLEYSITIPSIREELQGKAGIGDAIWEAEMGTVIGEVIDITYAPAVKETIDRATGQAVTTQVPGYMNIILTVQTEANAESGFYRVAEYEFQLGRTVTFCLPDLTGTGTITDMSFADIIPASETK